MGISFRHKGSFKNSESWLSKILRRNYMTVLARYGEMGVRALSANTPVRTGLTASSWSYEIKQEHGRVSVIWKNSNINKGVNIALILQYGHGTRNGGYVSGRDYINPALRPVFDKLAEDAWKEATTP